MSKNAQNIPVWISLPFSIFAWIITIILTILNFLLGLIVMMPLSLLFDKGSGRLMVLVAQTWARLIILLNPMWRIDVEGVENVKKGQCYVVIANHLSLLDILVVLAGVPVSFKFIAKKELFPIPFIGWHMTLAGYIPLDRKSKQSGKRAILQATDYIKRGISVLFFPEGTRSIDGEIKEFKMGAFKIAETTNCQILPVVIDGTSDAVPKHSWIAKKYSKFKVSIGKPVNFQEGANMEQVKNEIKSEMIERLSKLRNQ